METLIGIISWLGALGLVIAALVIGAMAFFIIMQFFVGRVAISAAIFFGAYAMIAFPDPRYAAYPAYQESGGNAAAIMILFGILALFAKPE